MGERLPIPGPAVTMNVEVLLGPLLTVTITGPVVVPSGTGTVILPEAQLDGTVDALLIVTELVLCDDPKFDPLIVSNVPAGPDVGDKVVMVGVPVTVNFTPVLGCPNTVTITLPVVVPAGTFTSIALADHNVGTALVPLNVTVLVPCVSRKFEPNIVIGVPTEPEV